MAWTLLTDATQRTDALLREAMGLDFSGWRNFAVTGSMLTIEKRQQGGWTRVYQESANRPGASGPYTPREGGAIFCYGINDIANVGQSNQVRDAFMMTLKACISRWRASVIFENDYGIGSRVVYSGFSQNNAFGDVGSGNSVHMTTTVGSTITLTLPTDYKGEPVVMSFLGKGSSDGATVTFSGSAGVTGTLSTSDWMPLFAFSRCPVIKRVTNLTAANAGQTIVITVNSFGGGSGDFMFDCWWLESLTPPPVIVCDIPKPTAAGYALYSNWSSGTESDKDIIVGLWNAELNVMLGEFDDMVQLAQLDTALQKDPALFIEGLHPNDAGGAKIVDAILQALQGLRPPTDQSPAASFAPAAPRTAGVVRTRLPGQWFGPDGRGIGTAYTAVAGDMFAMPFYISQPRSRFITMAVEALTSVTGTSVRWGIYDDVKGIGYPQVLLAEPTANGAFAITTGTGSKQSPASGTGSFNWAPDPGLYWLVVKFTAVGASHTFRTVAGPSMFLPNLGAGGLGNIQPSGWKLTGQGNTALPTVFPAGASLSDNCPIVAVYHL
ncbi:hypothetical protein [Nonomuraea roseoviolacea]|uniref:hypothetical protein n=1 Tax=Nonomuraea roseoviolacea TaxID=103837 RepID=UPI0031D08F08